MAFNSGEASDNTKEKEIPKFQNPFSESYVRNNISKSKPRMVFNNQIVENLKGKIKTDPVIGKMYNTIQINASEIQNQPLLERVQSGRRILAISREMLKRVNMLGVVYLIENDSAILERINQEVLAVCNFTDWNPSHFLDVAEMSMAVALALDWTNDQLPETTINLAKKSLIEKGIYPSWPEHGGKKQWWIAHNNNWNQVCNGGMIAASIAIADDDPELAAKTIKRALDGIPNALAEYLPDGVYPEGPGYWSYGTSYSVITSAILETSFGTDFGHKEYPGFIESAMFKVMCESPSGLYYNFSDCSDKSSETGDVILAWFAAKTGNSTFYQKDRFLLPSKDNNLSSLSGAALAWMSGYKEVSTMETSVAWFGRGSNPVVIFKDDKDSRNYFFGAKGGCGAMSHGNMDAGSFIFDLNGVRWSVDPGVQAYHELEKTGFKLWDQCQECERWKLLTKNNFGHSTLSVNGKLHVVDGSATLIDYKEGIKPEATFDLSPSFKGQLKNAKRKFIKDGHSALTIEDTFETIENTAYVVWQMITRAEVEIVPGGAILKQDGEELKLENLSHPDINVTVVSLDPPPHKLDKQIKDLKRIELKIPVSENNGRNNSLKILVQLKEN
jgi:hypothetical protein